MSRALQRARNVVGPPDRIEWRIRTASGLVRNFRTLKFDLWRQFAPFSLASYTRDCSTSAQHCFLQHLLNPSCVPKQCRQNLHRYWGTIEDSINGETIGFHENFYGLTTKHHWLSLPLLIIPYPSLYLCQQVSAHFGVVNKKWLDERHKTNKFNWPICSPELL
jgi:hypothetical protein